EERKSYTIPALEIIGFDLLLNQFNRRYFEGDDYDTSWSPIKENLQRSWVTDTDPYDINQLGHPYQGSMYHGFARSAGLGYWTSAAHTFPGEGLFRMSSLLLERGGGVPKFWRELGAAVVSPPTGFNRLAFGERFDPVFSSRSAAYYSRLGVALSGTTQ